MPYAGTTLPGYFWSPGPGRRPCVIGLQGLDSIKEVESYHFSVSLIERGLATLFFDGPGQSEGWERVKMDVRYEDAVSAVIDYLLTRGDVDPNGIGIFGPSLGGYLAPRAAAAEKRIRAAGGVAGWFDLSAGVASTAPNRQERFMIGWGVKSLEELMEKMDGATLDALPGAECPLLIVHGDKDAIISVEEAKRIHAWARGEKKLAIFEGGDHVCANRSVESVSLIADWLKEHLT